MKIFVRSVWSLLTAFFAILMIISFVGTAIAMKYEGQINAALKINLFRQEPNEDDDGVFAEHYKSDYFLRDANGNVKYTLSDDGARVPLYNDAAMRADSLDVAQRTADESSVLLWNDGALPLGGGAKIGFFGVSSQRSRYMYTGTGSGFISYSGTDDLKSTAESEGLDVYDALWNLYRFASAEYGYALVGSAAAGVSDANYGEYRIKEAPWDALERYDDGLTGTVLDDTNSYKDAAVMVISRNGGEDYDTNFVSDGDDCADGGCYLDLSAAERSILENLCGLKRENKINSVVLLVNSAVPVQTMTIDDYDIDACAWVGMGGTVAARQVARLLSGAANPSGHLVDTWVKDIDSAPANENFGDFTFAQSRGLPDFYKYTHNNKYLVYREGIYVGYKYYETRYEDYVLGQGNAASGKGVKAGKERWKYEDEVAFTFGHGESYTTFAYSDYNVTEKKAGEYEVSLTITNTGSVPGKDVMQLYIQKPYTDYDKNPAHRVEKAAVELIGFAKTDTLYPATEEGKPNSQTLTVTVNEYDFKSYDAYGQGTYILEKGDYYLAAGTSAHNALNNILAAKPLDETQKARMDERGDSSLAHKITIAADDFETYSVSPYTGAEVKNLFSDADVNLYEGTADQRINYLSRGDWDATYPSPASMKCTDEKMVADMQYYTGIVEDPDASIPKYETVGDTYGKLSLVMLADFDYDDPIWDALMDQTTYEEQTFLITYGAHVLAGAESVNAPGGLSQNGPSGINQPNPTLGSCMIFPCQVNMAATWNTALVEELGNAFGMEMMHVDYEGLNGPGANIHRSAYSGRNWEYFSEDGVMTGEMLSAETVGLMNRGCILYVKHMLLNDEERNRYGVSIWANEQTIRENYAKAFEKSCAVTGLNGIMSSFNRIGTTWAGRHKGLLNDLLRGEWGFEGAVQSDAAVGRHMGVANDAHTNAAIFAEALTAGQDFWLMGGSKTWMDEYKNNATVAQALREAARRMLYTQLHSHAINGMSAKDRIVRITPRWQSLLLALRIVSAAVTAVCAVITVLSFVFATGRFKRYSAAAPERKAARLAAADASAGPGTYRASGAAGSSVSGGGSSDTGGVYEASSPSSWLRRHKKPVIIAGAAVIAIITAVAIIVPVTMHGGAPLTPVPPPVDDPPAVHVCEQKCPICGGCLDAGCEEQVCATKCGAERKESYTFEAENSRVVTTPGAMGEISTFTNKKDVATGETVSGRGNFSSNSGASMSFTLAVEADTTVTLLARVSRGTGGVTRFTDTALPVLTYSDDGKDHSEVVERPTMVERTTTGTWNDYTEVNIGCINLKAGNNTIKFSPIGTAYNFDYIAMLADIPVTWSDGVPADIIGTPRHGLASSFADIGTDEHGVVTATVTATADLTKTASVTVNGKPVEKFSAAKADDENSYAVSFDLSEFGLNNGDGCSVVFISEDGKKLAAGSFAYKAYAVNINTAARDEAAWNTYELTAYVGPGSSKLSDGVTVSHPQNLKPATNRANGKGYYPIGNLDKAVGSSVTFRVASDKATDAGLYLELGNLGEAEKNAFRDWADISVNGIPYTSDADMPYGERYTPSNVYTRVGYVPLIGGVNVITVTVNNSNAYTAHNIYGIKLTADGANMSAAAEVPDDSAWTAYEFASYSAAGSQELAPNVTASSNLGPTTGRPNDDGFYPIGNLDGAKGSKVTFDIYSSEAADNVGLYMELSNLGKGEENTFDDWLDLDIDGANYDSSVKMPAADARYTPSNEYSFIRFVSLKAGNNRLTFTVNSDKKFNAHNIYGIKLTAKTAELTAADAADDAKWTAYEFSARPAGSDGFNQGVSAVKGSGSDLNAPSNRANAVGCRPIGNLNGNEGAKVTFTVHSDVKVAKVGLYIELSLRHNIVKFTDYLKPMAGGTDYTEGAKDAEIPRCAAAGDTFAPSNTYTFLCFIALEAGDNAISFTVVSGNTNIGANIYGIKLTAESAVLTPGRG